MELLTEEPDINWQVYPIIGAGIILRVGSRLCLQHRDLLAPTNPDQLSQWGGGAELIDKTVRAAACRELREEILAYAHPGELMFLGAHAYGPPQARRSLAVRYFMPVHAGRQLKCREGEARFFENAQEALAAPKLFHTGTRWALKTALQRGLVH